jgi:hypothetical protein
MAIIGKHRSEQWRSDRVVALDDISYGATIDPPAPERWFVIVRYPTDTFGISVRHAGGSRRRRIDVDKERLQTMCSVRQERVDGEEPPIPSIVSFFSDSQRTESLIRLSTDYPYAKVHHYSWGRGRIKLDGEGRGTAAEIHKVITDLLEAGNSLAEPPRPYPAICAL